MHIVLTIIFELRQPTIANWNLWTGASANLKSLARVVMEKIQLDWLHVPNFCRKRNMLHICSKQISVYLQFMHIGGSHPEGYTMLMATECTKESTSESFEWKRERSFVSIKHLLLHAVKERNVCMAIFCVRLPCFSNHNSSVLVCRYMAGFFEL